MNKRGTPLVEKEGCDVRLNRLAKCLDEAREQDVSRGAAVLIPIVTVAGEPSVLLEVRAKTLEVQPGEVCLPGGAIEPGETPQQAAVRETCEELCVSAEQIAVVGAMGPQPGPGGRPLHVFVGTLRDYEGTYSPDEVDHTFTLAVDWLVRHEPREFEVVMRPEYPAGFPWELVPGGKGYPWRPQKSRVPFYMGTDPVVWGATARVLMRFARIWAESDDRTTISSGALC